VAKDEAAGVRWFRRAADAGNTEAQFNLYTCYRDGVDGLRTGDPVGVGWLRKSAEGGFIFAQAELSFRLRDGDGMPSDAAEANTWGLRAADGGSSTAQADMGNRLLFGQGIPTNAVAGVALLRRAVDAGDLNACLHLGDAHAAGLGGLLVDKAAARALYERAIAEFDAAELATARMRLHELSSSCGHFCRIALPAEITPVCGHAVCGAALDAGTLSGLCAGCRTVRYCGADCQRDAWTTHRPACKAAVAARAAALAAAAPPSPSMLPPTAPSVALVAQRVEMEIWARMPLDTLRAAAGGGTAAAQGAIGLAYVTGTLGLEKDAAAGQEWLRMASAQGLLPARLRLGHTVLAAADTPGVNLSDLFAEARDLYQPLAEAGDAIAMRHLFICYVGLATACDGDGAATPLFAEAGRWLHGAAALAEPYALDALGIVAWDGNPRMGVARDRVEAARLYAAADAAGCQSQRGRCGRGGRLLHIECASGVGWVEH
jgi:TPR repeat protein